MTAESYTASEWAFRFILGLAIVVLMASWRFNTPSWSRTYTTSGRYHLALALYLAVEVFIYYLVSTALLVVHLDGIISSPLFSPVLLAMVITSIVLPRIPPFPYWRRALQAVAGVPHEAHRLGRVLVDAEFSPRDHVVQEVTAVLVRRGYDPEEHWLPIADSVQKLWLKAAIVFHQLRTWEIDSKREEFIRQSRNEFDVLRQRFDQLSMKVARTFGNIERLGTVLYRLTQPAGGGDGGGTAPSRETADDPEAKEMLKKTIADMLGNLREDIAFFLANACILVARGVLTTELTENARSKRFRELGFKVDAHPMQPLNVFLYVFLVVAASMVLSFAVLGTGSEDPGTKTHALRIVMVATIQITALGVAIVSKRLWGFANRDLFGRLPLRFVFAVGMAAVVVAGVVGLVFRISIFGSIGPAFDDLRVTYPWLLMAFTTAVTTSLLIQDGRWAWARSRSVQQRNDAIVTAGAMFVSIYVAQLCFWLIGSARFPARPDRPISEVVVGIVAVVMGACIGYVVPSAFREGRAPASEAAAKGMRGAADVARGSAPPGVSQPDSGRTQSPAAPEREYRL